MLKVTSIEEKRAQQDRELEEAKLALRTEFPQLSEQEVDDAFALNYNIMLLPGSFFADNPTLAQLQLKVARIHIRQSI